MNRLFTAPVALGALLLLLASAIGLGWIWLRAGRPEHIDPWQVAVLLIPLALLGMAVLNWGADRAQIAITVWVAVMFGGFLPLLVALHVGAAGPTGSAAATELSRYGQELTAPQRARLFEGALSDETTHNQGRAESMRIDAQWPFGTAYGVSWVALLVGFMVWLAPWAATVPPPPQIIPVAQQTLHSRLLALQTLAPALQWEPRDQANDLSVVYGFGGGKRTVKMRLRLDAQHGRVLAKEYSGVKGDAPITESEARMRFMRRPGEMVHPSADMVYSSDWNVTIPIEEKRHSLGVRVLGDSVQLPPQTIAHFTDDGPTGATDLPHLLAEIVHQSGWQWKGVFLF